MECLEGQTLKQRIQGKPLETDEILDLGIQIADGLDFAHAESIVHREIGARLNVDRIMEGSVRRAGYQIRVTAQRVKASDGYHLWSQRFDRETG